MNFELIYLSVLRKKVGLLFLDFGPPSAIKSLHYGLIAFQARSKLLALGIL